MHLITDSWMKWITRNNIRFPRWHSGEESACQCRGYKRCEFSSWVGKILWRRKWQPTIVFLPGKSHRQRRFVYYSPPGCKESCRTEQLNMYEEYNKAMRQLTCLYGYQQKLRFQRSLIYWFKQKTCKWKEKYKNV